MRSGPGETRGGDGGACLVGYGTVGGGGDSWKTLGIALRIIGCGEESQLVARPSEFTVLVIVARLLVNIV